MRGCRFFNSFCTVCVSRGVRVCSSTCGPSSDGQGVGNLPLRCAVLFRVRVLDVGHRPVAMRFHRFGYCTPTYAAMRQALSRVPSPMDHPAMNYYSSTTSKTKS